MKGHHHQLKMLVIPKVIQKGQKFLIFIQNIPIIMITLITVLRQNKNNNPLFKEIDLILQYQTTKTINTILTTITKICNIRL